MREIRFRGKSIKTGKWIYGNLVINKQIQKYQIIDETLYGKEVDKETIGQYTGLHDKNGKEIYEGDIVKDNYCIYKVVYEGNGYYIEVVKLLKECGTDKGILYDISDYTDLEVIGNIYNNKNLLESE